MLRDQDDQELARLVATETERASKAAQVAGGEFIAKLAAPIYAALLGGGPIPPLKQRAALRRLAIEEALILRLDAIDCVRSSDP